VLWEDARGGYVDLRVGAERQADVQSMRLGMEKVIKRLLDNPDGYTRTSLLPFLVLQGPG
jgi:hypothetical protein